MRAVRSVTLTRVEGARRVQPAHMADQTLLAVDELLSADAHGDGVFAAPMSANAMRRSNGALNGVPVGPTVFLATRASCTWT